jgi:nitric oxide reductase large subunit
MQALRWLRVPGDTLFGLGAFILVGFVFTTRSHGPKVAAKAAIIPVVVGR